MKAVIISDIHGNLEAIRSLPESFDELWVLGDLVNYGPDPADVVEFVQSKATLVVRGNHDHAVGYGEDPRCSAPFREMAEAMMRYTRSVLSGPQRKFLRSLPMTSGRNADGVRIKLCHATPSDPLFAYCGPDSPQWEREVELAGADMLLVGHTHLPFVRRFGKQQVVNPGSLGQPKTGRPAACYAVWEKGEVELRSFNYAFEETIRKIHALPVDQKVRARLADVLRNGGLPP
jgi:putative phosphoesterase